MTIDGIVRGTRYPVRGFDSTGQNEEGRGFAGAEGVTYCPPPQMRQRRRQPAAEEPGSRRKGWHPWTPL